MAEMFDGPEPEGDEEGFEYIPQLGIYLRPEDARAYEEEMRVALAERTK